MGQWISPPPPDEGGGGEAPSNPAPRRRSEKQKNAFESSSEIITKVYLFICLFIKIIITTGDNTQLRL